MSAVKVINIGNGDSEGIEDGNNNSKDDEAGDCKHNETNW